MKSLVLIGFLLMTFTLAQAVTWTTIDYPGAILTSANGINSSGQIVGNYIDGEFHGFLLSNGVYTTIDFPGAATWCEGINDSGDVVGFYELGGELRLHGFLWHAGTFTTVDFPGSLSSAAYGINNGGQIVGSYYTASVRDGFEYDDGNYVDIAVPDATFTELRGIDNVGDIVGDFTNVQGFTHGLLLSNGTLHILNAPAAHSTFAIGVNDHNHIVGYESLVQGVGAFTYFLGNYGQIGRQGSLNVETLGMNNSFAMVGQYTDHKTITHGFLRTLD